MEPGILILIPKGPNLLSGAPRASTNTAQALMFTLVTWAVTGIALPAAPGSDCFCTTVFSFGLLTLKKMLRG